MEVAYHKLLPPAQRGGPAAALSAQNITTALPRRGLSEIQAL